MLVLSAIMLAMTACNDTDEPMSPAAQSVTFSISESAFGPESRASDQRYMTGFTVGDACGLYIVRNGNIACSNVKLTAAESEGSLIWQAETPVGGGLPAESYYLYYPYQSDMDGKVDATATDADGFFAPLVSGWQPAADQSTYADYTASDLMTAQGTASKRSDGTLLLSFSMTHRMALAVIEMPKTVYKFTDASIPDYTGGTSADFTASDIQPYAIAPGTYRCIVNPAGTPTNIVGSYADGKKEFAITPSAAQGSYKTYKIDGLTPIEKQAILKMGDYFCKNSDNNWYIIPQEATPDDKVIGIVFYAGQHDTDTSDYTSTDIGQAQCHGYVVALQDAAIDRCMWGVYGTELGCFPTDTDGNKQNNRNNPDIDWNGYAWTQKIIAAAGGKDNLNATEQAGYPATWYAVVDYPKKEAAPTGSSGWFLPSIGQLRKIYQNRSSLFGSVSGTGLKSNWYVSSSEYYASPAEDALYVDVYSGNVNLGSKDNRMNCEVRPILAF